jgi:hypothetical protein
MLLRLTKGIRSHALLIVAVLQYSRLIRLHQKPCVPSSNAQVFLLAHDLIWPRIDGLRLSLVSLAILFRRSVLFCCSRCSAVDLACEPAPVSIRCTCTAPERRKSPPPPLRKVEEF